jgi:hypothetical protein
MSGQEIQAQTTYLNCTGLGMVCQAPAQYGTVTVTVPHTRRGVCFRYKRYFRPFWPILTAELFSSNGVFVRARTRRSNVMCELSELTHYTELLRIMSLSSSEFVPFYSLISNLVS